jgi:hypothetical protein
MHLYGILTKSLSNSIAFVTGWFMVFALVISFGIWRFIKKKSVEYVNMDGWKYKLFRRGKKYLFIWITGGLKALSACVSFSSLYFFGLLKMDSPLGIKEYAGIIVLYIIFAFMIGFAEHKKYKSIDFETPIDFGIPK